MKLETLSAKAPLALAYVGTDRVLDTIEKWTGPHAGGVKYNIPSQHSHLFIIYAGGHPVYLSRRSLQVKAVVEYLAGGRQQLDLQLLTHTSIAEADKAAWALLKEVGTTFCTNHPGTLLNPVCWTNDGQTWVAPNADFNGEFNAVKAAPIWHPFDSATGSMGRTSPPHTASSPTPAPAAKTAPGTTWPGAEPISQLADRIAHLIGQNNLVAARRELLNARRKQLVARHEFQYSHVNI